MSRAFREKYLGKQVEILLEEEIMLEGVRYQTGYTREYVRVGVPSEEDLSGKVLTGTLERFLTKDMLLVFSG